MGLGPRPHAVRKTLPPSPAAQRANAAAAAAVAAREREVDDEIEEVQEIRVEGNTKVEWQIDDRIDETMGPPNLPMGGRNSRRGMGKARRRGGRGARVSNRWGSEWLRRSMQSRERRLEVKYVDDQAHDMDGDTLVKIPEHRCQLSDQETFCAKIADLINEGLSLSGRVELQDVSGAEDMAKVRMSINEKEMYEIWASGETVPPEDWEEVEITPTERRIWEQRGKDLGVLYRMAEGVGPEKAKWWWHQDRVLKPLAVAIGIIREERRQAEIESCIVILAQMRLHHDLVQVGRARYGRYAFRRYAKNVRNVIDLVIERKEALTNDHKIEENWDPVKTEP